MNYWWIGFIVLVLIVLIIVLIYLWKRPKIVEGSGSPGEKITIIDGLNYIMQHIKAEDPNTLTEYPDTVQIYKYVNLMRKEYPGNLVIVLKNQDGYYLSKYDAQLFEQLAMRNNCTIMVAYDYNPPGESHISRARDDSLLIKTTDALKKSGYSVQIVSKDKFRDIQLHDEVPEYQILQWSSNSN